MRKNLGVVGLILLAMIIVGCNKPVTDDLPPVPNPDEVSDEPMMDITFQNRIVIENVSTMPIEGEGFYGVNDGETRVVVDFNMADPEEDYFYEGWLLCEGKPYSTGKLEKNENLWVNYFASKKLPEVCDRYVLTLEPNDNDPAPGEHFAVGTMEGIAHTDTNVPDWDDEYFGFATKPVDQLVYACGDEFEFTLNIDNGKYFYVPADSGVSTELFEQVSASGAKYGTEDESIVVLEKAGEASVMTDGEVAHDKCVAAL